MAGHKPNEKKKMMGGGRLYAKDGLYAMKKRKSKKHGGPHNNMDRIGMAIGGAMDVQSPN